MMINGARVQSGLPQAAAESYAYAGALVADTTAAVGGVVKLLNDTGYDLMVKTCAVEITTGSTGAATLSGGNSADGTTAASNAVNASNAQTVGVARGNLIRWKKNQYFVLTGSATLAGLVGTYLLECAPVN